jgi:hypothetical protein
MIGTKRITLFQAAANGPCRLSVSIKPNRPERTSETIWRDLHGAEWLLEDGQKDESSGGV